MPCVVWMHPSDCDPPHGLDMESEHDRTKVLGLVVAFAEVGFDRRFPALVGYPNGAGRIQLLSGTHRHRAAEMTNTYLPVTLWLRTDVESSWGLEDWMRVMKDVPVQELEKWTREDVEKHRSLMSRRRDHLSPPSNPFVESEHGLCP